MFAGGVGRIFREFDEYLDSSYDKREQQGTVDTALNWKKKNLKKLKNYVENFVEEISCLLCVEKSELAWGFIFYNRMLSNKTLVSVKRYDMYVEALSDYMECVQDFKPKIVKKKQSLICSTKNLCHYLATHRVDPDNVLIGLPPSPNISKRYKDQMDGDTDHKEAAKLLSETEGNGDPLALYFVGFPGKKGDVVVATVPTSKMTSHDLRIYEDKGDTALVFARIKEAVEFNKKTFLTLWTAPIEEEELSLPASDCIPLLQLIPGESWIGKEQRMRDLVADTYTELEKFLEKKFVTILASKLSKLHVPEIYKGLQDNPVSFLYFHLLSTLEPSLNALIRADRVKSQPKIKKKRETFMLEATACVVEHQKRLFEEIQTIDGSNNKLFMLTSEQDLLKLSSLHPEEMAKNFLLKFQAAVKAGIAAMEGERQQLMCGSLKNQISKWWCLIIQTKKRIILGKTEYDKTAYCQDTYIDEAPRDIEGVKKNLEIIQNLLNAQHAAHQLVSDAIEEIKSQVYPVIDEFIMKAHVVLSQDLLGRNISLHYTPDLFDMEEIMAAFAAKKDELMASDGDVYKQLDGLIKDLSYLVQMKNLEYKTTDDKSQNAKLQLSYAVPLSGLVIGEFFREENQLKTVIELWAHKCVPLPDVTSPRESDKDGDSSVLCSPKKKTVVEEKEEYIPKEILFTAPVLIDEVPNDDSVPKKKRVRKGSHGSLGKKKRKPKSNTMEVKDFAAAKDELRNSPPTFEEPLVPKKEKPKNRSSSAQEEVKRRRRNTGLTTNRTMKKSNTEVVISRHVEPNE